MFEFNNAHTISKTQAITLYKQNTTTLLTLIKASENTIFKKKTVNMLTFLLKMLNSSPTYRLDTAFKVKENNLISNNYVLFKILEPLALRILVLSWIVKNIPGSLVINNLNGLQIKPDKSLNKFHYRECSLLSICGLLYFLFFKK